MTTAHPSRTGTRLMSRAFTLIELLVVVMIIGLLLAILLPALKSARALGYQVKEMAAANQKMIGWTHYSTENKDAAFTGYIPWAAGHLGSQVGNNLWLHPDPWMPSHCLEGNVIKVNGLRFMGAMGFSEQDMMLHKPTLNDFLTRPNVPTYGQSQRPRTTLYDGNPITLAAAMAYHPSLGMNATYVGGNWHRGAMQGYAVGGAIGHPRPKWYVTATYEVQRPDTLMVFTSARGVDVKTAGGWGSHSWGRNPLPWTQSSTVVPGFWEVVPPRVGFPQNAPTPMGPWVNTNSFKEISNPKDWGFVHPRHNNRAVTAMVDGHVSMQSLEQLRDMRKWANKATRADWTFRPN